jgi:hypothetical protein
MPFNSFSFLSKHFKKGTHDAISKTIVINYKSSTFKKQITEKISSYVIFLGVIITCLIFTFFSEYIFDTDKDGIKDKYDLCPKEFGGFKGCPDNDKDGVNNSDDWCPDEYGEYNGCLVKKSLILKNETDYEIRYAITYYDAEKDDYISIGHYSILPHENFDYPLPENFIQDNVWIRGYYINENGDESTYFDEESIDNIFYYQYEGFEKYNKNLKSDSKVNYRKIELTGETTEHELIE